MISRDMKISDIVEQYPQVAELFMEYGLACVGCHISDLETIEEGATGHGMDEQTLDMMLRDANELIKHSDAVEKPEDITVTAAAVKQMKTLMIKNNNPFGVFRLPECILEEKVKENDEILFKDGVRIVVDKEQYGTLLGKSVDFEEDFIINGRSD